MDQHRVIPIGIDGNWPPIDFWDQNGQASGISANTLKIIEQRLGITFTPVAGPTFKNMLNEVMTGDVKIGSTISWRKDRAEKLCFTNPFFKVKYVILTQKMDASIRTLNDLKGKIVAVVDGYFLMKALLEKFPDMKFQIAKNTQEALEMVSWGNTDAYVGNQIVADWIVQEKHLTNLKVAADSGFAENPQRFAIYKDPEFRPLVELFNRALASLSESEKHQISHDYLGLNDTAPTQPIPIGLTHSWRQASQHH